MGQLKIDAKEAKTVSLCAAEGLRVSVPVVKSGDDGVHWLAVGVEDDVVVFYLDGRELCKTDFENVEDLMAAIGLLWGGWVKVQKQVEEARNVEALRM